VLALGFEVGGARYAVRCAELVELVPRVPLRPVPHAPDYVPGQFTYRGEVTPVVDLALLMTGRPAGERLSSRILVAAYPTPGGVRALGLLAERATEAVHLEGRGAPPGIDVPEAPYLGELHFDGRAMVQLVKVGELLPDGLRDRLFPAEAGPAA
jgi:chemotaxis-related protein WspB